MEVIDEPLAGFTAFDLPKLLFDFLQQLLIRRYTFNKERSCAP